MVVAVVTVGVRRNTTVGIAMVTVELLEAVVL